jgi:DNA-binding LytR/AlgR family response regulator
MTIQCIIVDDEPLAREGLSLLIHDIDFLQLRAQCTNPLEANAILSQQKIDLMFLDIQMPKMRGTDFLKSLPVKPLTIITTAYPNFALEGFELNVLDYLVKPITPERFLTAVNRARSVLEARVEATITVEDDYLFIKCNNGYEKIRHSEVLFVEAAQNYITLHTTTGKFMTLATMKAVEEQLPATQFLRIHKSYLIARDKIQSFIGNEIVIATHRLPVGKNYKDDVMKMIDSKLIKK